MAGPFAFTNDITSLVTYISIGIEFEILIFVYAGKGELHAILYSIVHTVSLL